MNVVGTVLLTSIDNPMCSVDKCGKKRHCRGYCKMHYTRLLRHGSPTALVGTANGEWRRWLKTQIVRDDDGCWMWPFGLDSQGYGKVYIENKTHKAHRVIWEMLRNEKIPPGQVLRHFECDEPLCVNPSHMRPGTYQDNSDDMVRKKRHRYGTRNPAAKLNEDQIKAIRASSEPTAVVARAFGISSVQVRNIRSRKHWREL